MPQPTSDSMQQTKRRRPRAWAWCAAFLCACQLASVVPVAQSQSPGVRRAKVQREAGRVEAGRNIDELVRRAVNVTCAERELDPQGSAPIDEMQAQPSLP